MDRHYIIMKTVSLAEAKTHFSALLKDVSLGDEVAIAYGRKKETIAVIIPYKTWQKSKKRQLGSLEGKGAVKFSKDFSITDEELINS
jgi:antitoxin (DNA-binding transcriptional repressor) of toxin-antitoxin stability system